MDRPEQAEYPIPMMVDPPPPPETEKLTPERPPLMTNSAPSPAFESGYTGVKQLPKPFTSYINLRAGDNETDWRRKTPARRATPNSPVGPYRTSPARRGSKYSPFGQRNSPARRPGGSYSPKQKKSLMQEFEKLSKVLGCTEQHIQKTKRIKGSLADICNTLGLYDYDSEEQEGNPTLKRNKRIKGCLAEIFDLLTGSESEERHDNINKSIEECLTQISNVLVLAEKQKDDEGTTSKEDDIDGDEVEEVSHEIVGESLKIKLRCPCGHGYELFFTGGLFYYKILLI